MKVDDQEEVTDRKPRLVYRDGSWWCIGLGIVGRGITPQAAYDDMLMLYGKGIPDVWILHNRVIPDMWMIHSKAVHDFRNRNNPIYCPIKIRG